MVYVLISIAILAMVVSAAITLISDSKEQGNYKTMLTNFVTIKAVVEDVVSDKQTIEIIINNPGEINIDCNNNIITGEIDYTDNYREDITPIQDIDTYFAENKVHFEYNLERYNRITLDCNKLDTNCLEVGYCYNDYLNIGRNIVEFEYIDYNEESDTILVSVLRKNVVTNE